MLSQTFTQVKKFRSAGNYAAALNLIAASELRSDEDAFEAVICSFTAGDFENVLKHGGTYRWRQSWPLKASQALAGMILRKDPAAALALAKAAAGEPGANWDAVAVYLILLQANGLIDDAAAYVRKHAQNPPPDEILLLTVLGEIAVATNDWMRAYTLAMSVLAVDPNNYRALVFSSMANYEFGNIHESLGNAMRANRVNPNGQPATLQLMRCYNKLGDFYSTLSAFRNVSSEKSILPEIHAQHGVAYARLGAIGKAIEAYNTALDSTHKPITAIKGLLKIYINTGAEQELKDLLARHGGDVHGDIESVNSLALYRLLQRDLDASYRLFREAFTLTRDHEVALTSLQWPVPEPRLRHDYEQLTLLKQGGKLSESGARALDVLTQYHDPTNDVRRSFAPTGAAGEALRGALAGFHHCPDSPFSGRALGENDYTAIESSFFNADPKLVVIDHFLSPSALANLREYCEEATIWKSYFDNGYVGTTLPGGFSARVLLAIADELKQAMPKVIGDAPLTQAWAFKYDQRMQGINMHADFANVNVNFWITPDDGCEDKTTGGMVVYDVPAPANWTFEDYNGNSGKMQAFIEENNARPLRVPYHENRCVLFDSTLFHTTDEIHFKSGYCNRRVNVTFLFGKSRHTD